MQRAPHSQLPAKIGPYEVLRKIATGGMAELFIAKQVGMEGFEKVVAIKRILAHLAHDEEFLNMFRDEARIVAKLSHPHIVQIYDLAKEDDTYFIAMEYIAGRNLSSVAKRTRSSGRRLPPAYIARCVAQACEGLHYAHTQRDLDGKPLNIVHRDVSPQNIIVAFTGQTKLVDFGIAKAATKIAQTRLGVLKGKYAYMSPEQIRGRAIDHRSDLFAVGIVLYELLGGRRPFEKENSIQTLKAIVQEEPVDVRKLNPDIPPELAKIIQRALKKRRRSRYQTAQEIQLDLEDFVAAQKDRVNNLTIADWLHSIFDGDLNRRDGATVVFKGIGEVILPDVQVETAEPAGEDLASEEDRPPIQAPSLALEGLGAQEGQASGPPASSEPPPRRSSSAAERSPMLEEGVRAAATAADAGAEGSRTQLAMDLEDVPEPELEADGGWNDDKTAFNPHLPEFDDTHGVPGGQGPTGEDAPPIELPGETIDRGHSADVQPAAEPAKAPPSTTHLDAPTSEAADECTVAGLDAEAMLAGAPMPVIDESSKTRSERSSDQRLAPGAPPKVSLTPKVPPPLAPPNPVAAIGSSKVPAANVSLSEVLVDSRRSSPQAPAPEEPATGIRSATRPRDDGARGADLAKGLGIPISEAKTPPTSPRNKDVWLHRAIIAVGGLMLSGLFYLIANQSPVLQILTTPVAARVMVDGQLIEGETPLEIEVQPGTNYRIEVLAEGYESRVGIVQIDPNDQTSRVNFELTRE